MHALSKNWQGGYLDYYCHPGEVRLNVLVWATLSFSGEQYFVRSKDLRMALGYLRKIGLSALVRKVRSRLSESERNEKYLSVGIGTICEPSSTPRYRSGQQVVFLAYNYPRCVDQLVLDDRFITAWPYEALSDARARINFFDATSDDSPAELLSYAGWSAFSGAEVDETQLATALTQAVNILKKILDDNRQPKMELESAPARATQDQTPPVRSQHAGQQKAMRGVLFGLGNYAKTVILPYVGRYIHIDKIHEIDPLQLGRANKWRAQLDTSGIPRADDEHDVYFIAGYHHTHTPIALHALSQSAYAVIEKPIAVNRQQIEALRKALEGQPSRFFACFHKRYSEFNDLALADLQLQRGEPLTYHCIVYEVPLPLKHWYRWPNSGSRIVSNGCHWIDHFLYLNNYAEIANYAVYDAQQGDMIVLIELVNGAVFSMVLTDIGSERLGVREYVELKANHVTVRIVDGTRYESENSSRILRRRRVNPMASFERMYQTISRKIVNGEHGDSLDSLQSSELAIALDEKIRGDASAVSTPGVNRASAH